MTTYREAIYMCLDLVKGMSDDFSYTEEHIAFLIDKTRALLLKQRYGNDPKKHVPYSNYQTINIELLPPNSKKKVNQILPNWENMGVLYSTYPVASDINIVLKEYKGTQYDESTGSYVKVYETIKEVVFPKGESSINTDIMFDLYELSIKKDSKYLYYTNTERPEGDVEEPLNNSTKYYISSFEIPFTLQLGIPRVTISDYYDITFDFISRERFPFVGYNKYLKNIRYCCVDQNNLLKVLPKENDDLTTIQLTAIFENPRELFSNDYLDESIPIEEGLVNNLIEMVVQKISGSMYIPNDDQNNAKDDKADMRSFIANNMKSDLTKQL